MLALWLRLGLGHGDHLSALGLLVIFFVVAAKSGRAAGGEIREATRAQRIEQSGSRTTNTPTPIRAAHARARTST